MRLSNKEILVLKTKLYNLCSDAKLYLFGSRLDDNAKGGDIDLLVVSNRLTKKDIRLLRLDFFDNFGEQKLDIILDDGKFNKVFNKMIFKQALAL